MPQLQAFTWGCGIFILKIPVKKLEIYINKVGVFTPQIEAAAPIF